MNVLLDTNIFIHRENTENINDSIGELFFWLEDLKCVKFIHESSVSEIKKFQDVKIQNNYQIKLKNYITWNKKICNNKDLLSNYQSNDNDITDNDLIHEIYCPTCRGTIDYIITEDKALISKSKKLNIGEEVFSIKTFIDFAKLRSTKYIERDNSKVQRIEFNKIDVKDNFFDSLRKDYGEENFNNWFKKKCNEKAYIEKDYNNNIQGFLYLKIEEKEENYNDITPQFEIKKRLKIGTFKINRSGYRLSDHFFSIIFEIAIEKKVEEIYFTIFTNFNENISDDKEILIKLSEEWGFAKWGQKIKGINKEDVYIKKMFYQNDLNIKQNYPNINYDVKKIILPIKYSYHDILLPDIENNDASKVNVEKKGINFALEKIYISHAEPFYIPKEGEIILFYRMGKTIPKSESSYLSSIGVITKIKCDLKNEEELIKYCKDITVFDEKELKKMWKEKEKMIIIKFIIILNFNNYVFLKDLQSMGMIPFGEGPRPFRKIDNYYYNEIIKKSGINLYKGCKNESNNIIYKTRICK
ncbi:MAG: hypothetical protein ACRCW6_02015 [Mycoplasmoidaceae bacterium]